jgi:hypothetical protein
LIGGFTHPRAKHAPSARRAPTDVRRDRATRVNSTRLTAAVVIGVVYLVTRLIFIAGFPYFLDEGS